MKKSILIMTLMIIIICIIFFIVFNKNTSKLLKNGNNMSSQEIVDYILKISSYKAKVEIEVISNKNNNKYVIYQEYISPNTNKQEILEPSNIAGIKIIKDENKVTLENSRLSLSNIYENYNYLADNCLDLSTFINDYNNSNSSIYEENNNQIIMKTVNINNRTYSNNKTLYIDKKTQKPIKLEIKDNNEKTTINILYKEIEIV